MSFRNITWTVSVLIASGLATLTPSLAQAQLCETTSRTDPINWSYNPNPPFSGRTGFLAVQADDIIADDEHDRRSLEVSFVPKASDHQFTAEARVNLTDAVAHMETYLFGYGEAGIEIVMETFSGGVIQSTCTTELYIARYNEHGTSPLGVRNLTCPMPDRTPSTTPVRVRITFHAWVTLGGAASGYARVNGTVESVSMRSCSGSCRTHCEEQAPEGCFCDAACANFGDCCGDYAPMCNTGSCWNQCGGSSPSGSCWCDAACTNLGDCCTDFPNACE